MTPTSFAICRVVVASYPWAANRRTAVLKIDVFLLTPAPGFDALVVEPFSIGGKNQSETALVDTKSHVNLCLPALLKARTNNDEESYHRLCGSDDCCFPDSTLRIHINLAGSSSSAKSMITN